MSQPDPYPGYEHWRAKMYGNPRYSVYKQVSMHYLVGNPAKYSKRMRAQVVINWDGGYAMLCLFPPKVVHSGGINASPVQRA